MPLPAHPTPAGSTRYQAADGSASLATRRAGMRVPVRMILATLSGLAYWLSLPGWDIWVLAPLSVALLTLATRGTTVWRGAGLGALTGLVGFGPVLWWAGEFVGRLPWAGLTVFQAAYLAILGAASAYVQRGRQGLPLVAPLSIAALWVGQETLRGNLPWGGFPWARLAYSQGDSPMLRWAAVIGAPGLTFVTALVGTLMAALWVAWHKPAPGGPAPWARDPASQPVPSFRRATTIPAVAIIFLVLFAPPVDAGDNSAGSLRVMAVQGNVPRPGLDFNAKAREVLEYHVGATHRGLDHLDAAGAARPDLILWPENAADIDPLHDAESARQIRTVVDRAQVPVGVGAVLVGEEGTTNTVLFYRPGEEIPSLRYTKKHPVPFAEYMPMRDFFRNFTSAVDLAGYFVPGDNPNTVTMSLADRLPMIHPGVTIGIGICFESAYDGLMREAVRDGAQFLYIPTNNGTFGFTDEAVQQLAISRVRAVEFGRTVVHISNVGISGLVRSDGEVDQRTGHFEEAIVYGEVPLSSKRTIAASLPVDPQWIGAAGALLALAYAAWRRHGPGGTAAPRLELSDRGDGQTPDPLRREEGSASDD